jgi:hypothetical protein
MTTAACDLCQQPVSPDQLITLSGKRICAKCKPDAVMNLKSGVGMSSAVSPQKADEIKRKISRLNLLSFVFAIPGLILQFAGPGLLLSGHTGPGLAGLVLLIRLLAVPLIIAGLVCYALMKGRGGAFGLLGLLSCLGLLILHFLPKACHNCKASASYSAKQCRDCGAPM